MSIQGYYARDWVKGQDPNEQNYPQPVNKPNRLWLWILLALIVLALIALFVKIKFFSNDWEKSVVYIKSVQGTSVYSGSGTIISPDGYILTNKHVLFDKQGRPLTNIMVVVNSGEENNEQYPARVDYIDPAPVQEGVRASMIHDCAVLKIDPKGKELPYISIGRSEDLPREAVVYAAGFPLGDLASTSSRGPDLKSEPGTISRTQKDDTNHTVILIHSVALVGGNSGGPLLDSSRHLIGINTSTPTDGEGRKENLAIASGALGKGLLHAKDDPYSKQ